MQTHDILFKTDGWVFSYRVGGILIRDGKILLQRPPGDPGYAFPGGHVIFGETGEEALIREYKEELSADITPIRLLWVAENFFPWGESRCHQVCFYYQVTLQNEAQISLEGSFYARDELDQQTINLELSWIPLEDLDRIEVYPTHAKEKLKHLADAIEHWVYKQ